MTKKQDPFRTEIMKEVKSIKKILLGNGEVGVLEKVRNNENDMKLIKKVLMVIILLLVSSGGITITQISQLIKTFGG